MTGKRTFMALEICAFLFIAASGMAMENLVNGGFEETQIMDQKSGYTEILTNAGWKFDTPLVFPVSWKTNSGVKTINGEYRLVTDPALAHGGNNSVFIRGHISTGKVSEVSPGEKYEITFYAKDPGMKPVSAHFYLYGLNDKNKMSFASSISFSGKTNAEWTKITGILEIPEKGANVEKISGATLAISSNNGAYIDDVQILQKKAE